MQEREQLCKFAEAILVERKRREALFPKEIFDEYAWEMLLALYVISVRGDEARNQDLIELAGCKPAVGERWIAHLIAQNQVRKDGQVVHLDDSAHAAIEQYLRGSLSDAQQVLGADAGPEG